MSPRTASRRVPGVALVLMAAAFLGTRDLRAAATVSEVVPLTPGVPLLENFDEVTPPALPPGWLAANAQGHDPLWVTAAVEAQTPPNSAHIGTSLLFTPFDEWLDSIPISIATASAQLSFYHEYGFFIDPGAHPQDFPTAFGRLEISIGGGPFQNVTDAGGTFVEGGYPDSGSEWIGQNADPPACCVHVVVNLPAAAAGSVIVLRWHTNGSPGPDGTGASWSVDTIQICDGFACDGVPQPVTTEVDSAGNGVWEPGETVDVDPDYLNNGTVALDLSGTATTLTGPVGATYTITDSAATYGSIDPGTQGNCSTTPDCYSVSVDDPAVRPAPHWDAQLTEALSNGPSVIRVLHIGSSFPDVPPSNQFYAFIENLFHNGVTGGCGGGDYCPGNSVTRSQMAVFLLKAKHSSLFVPPACTGIFGDVACPGGFAVNWIEQLFHEGVTGGCGGGDYCPDNPVTRSQMAVFLLKALLGSSYTPPAATGIFGDVPIASFAADWIEDLYNRGITGGCQASPLLYCPNNPNTRGQMAVYLVKTFGLLLYGP
jgi:S-layer homology domain